jgi:hypothetical protein
MSTLVFRANYATHAQSWWILQSTNTTEIESTSRYRMTGRDGLEYFVFFDISATKESMESKTEGIIESTRHMGETYEIIELTPETDKEV